MAFSNEAEITSYIEKLKQIKYSDKGSVKTGVDNYKVIISYVESILEKRKKEKQLLLNNINTQLAKCQYYISKLESNLTTTGKYENVNVFQQNIQTLGDTSSEMLNISENLLSIISVDLARLKQYKRRQKELLAKSVNLKNILKFYEDSATTLTELKTKLV